MVEAMDDSAERWDALREQVQQRMVEIDVTEADVIRRSGLARPTVNALIKGVPKNPPTPTTLHRFSRALGWTPESAQLILEGQAPQPLTPEQGLVAVRAAADNLQRGLDELRRLLDSA